MGRHGILVLLSQSYPFGAGETFMTAELAALSMRFDRILIQPLQGGGEARAVPDNVCVLPPIQVVEGRMRRGFHAILGLRHAWVRRDLAGATPRRTIDKFYRFVLGRAYARHPRVREWITDRKVSALYFYWGTGLADMVPHLPVGGPPVVVRLHRGDLYEERDNRSHTDFAFRARLVQRAGHLVFVSQHGLDYLSERYPTARAKSVLFRLGVAKQQPNPGSNGGPLRLLSCSNMVTVKRLHLLVDGLARCAVPVHWTHLGDGPLRSQIEERTRDLPPHVVARLLGHKPHEQVLEYYRQQPVDLFVNVSSSEGVPVSVMEALSFGVPVVATAVGGTAELIDETVGALLPPNVGPIELANVIEKLATRTDASTLRRNALERWAQRANGEECNLRFADYLWSLSNG
ncbi:MAG: glycosyltransferase [Myxococcales bacterium]|nr:glycosyltransferase [Myxococcales bacterium]